MPVIRRASETILATPGVKDAVAFVGFDGATFTNAPNTGVDLHRPAILRGAREAGAERQCHPGRPAGTAVRRPGCARAGHPAAPVPGIGTGGGFKLMIQDRAGRGPQALEAATQQVVAARRTRRPASPSPSACSTPRRRRSGPKSTGRGPRCWACRSPASRRHRHLYGLGLRQRLQPARPHLAGDGAGRHGPPHDGRGRRPAAHPGRSRGDGAARQRRHLPGDLRSLSRAALQPLSGGRGAGRGAAGHLRRPGASRRWKRWCATGAARGLRLRMDRTRAAGEASPATPRRSPSAWRWSSSSWCWRRCTRAGCCRWPWC